MSLRIFTGTFAFCFLYALFKYSAGYGSQSPAGFARQYDTRYENDPTCILYLLTSLFKDNMHEGLSTVELYQHTYIWDNQQVKEKFKNSNIKSRSSTKNCW